MLTEKVLLEIPENFIENLGFNRAKEQANKFAWINSDSFVSVSKEGLERNFYMKN